MQRKTAVASLAKLVSCAILVSGAVLQAGAADEKKADPTGTWTWTMAGRQGGPERTNTLTLKLEGEKLTGKLAAPGRGGGPPTDVEIKDGKIKGDEVSFSIVREFNGNSVTTKYSGKISGDTIKGKIELPAGRDGQPRDPVDWLAKKSTEAKK